MPRPPVRPVVWQPPPTPPRARETTGPEPVTLRRIEVNGKGPEDVVVDGDGRIVTGVDDGRVLRLTPDGRHIEVVADTGGRPLGIELFPDGSLLVCDARRGLLRVDPASGDVEPLVEQVDGERLLFCNNADIAADGTVYFTDSSRRFPIDHWRGDLYEHSGTGRLFRRAPDGTVQTLLDGLQFANGVALAADESFVAVAETGSYQVTRLWLAGPDAGRRDVLIGNLPGFPDNIARGSDGLIWVTQASPRDPRLDRLHTLPPMLRRALWSLPPALQPNPARTAWVLAVDGDGAVVRDLQAPGRDYHMVTGVREHHGTVYLGSLVERAVAVMTTP